MLVRDNISAKALIFLFLGAAAISLAPILVRLSELGPIATVFYRISFALPFYLFGCV